MQNKSTIVSALKYAIPYIKLYKGKIFVIKAGGELFNSPLLTKKLIEQIGIFHQFGIRIILIHGGGTQLTKMATSLGIKTKFVDGRRITDADSIDVATMVMNGQINTKILATARDLEIPAIGMSGVDAGLICAHRREITKSKGNKSIDYGFVGEIDSVNTNLLEKQLEAGLIPVISPLTCDKDGVILNINADTVAASIAAELNAEKLILVTSVPGILEKKDNPSTLISYLNRDNLKKMKDDGRLSDGMLPKAEAIEHALKEGVARVHIISYQVPDSLLIEVFTNDGTGTLIINDVAALSSFEQSGERF